MEQYTFLSATVLLILITDPIGNIPIFANALRDVDPKRRQWIVIREIAIAFCVLMTFLFFGSAFLKFMNLSALSLQLAGALILFLIALRMVFPPTVGGGCAACVPQMDTNKQEPLIVPLAIPAIAGPSAMATVMLLASQAPEQKLLWVGVIGCAMLVSALVLLLSGWIERVVGERVVVAGERLMGLILVALSVEMLLQALKSLGLITKLSVGA